MSNWWTRTFPPRPRTIRRRPSGIRLDMQLLETRDTPSMTVGPNINITKSSGQDQETSIIVNPTNPNNLFATSTASGVSRFSLNGGVTWTDSNISGVLGGGNGGDQQEAWDNFGNLFMTYFGGPNDNTVVALSTDGGKTFSLSLDTGSLQDQPNIVASNGEVWVDYTTASGRKAQGAKVTGLGQVGPWSAGQVMPGNRGTFGDLAIGPNGQVFSVYQENNGNGAPAQMYANLNPTGLGGTFGAQISLGTTNVGSFDAITPQPTRTIDSEMSLAWDRSNGPHRGRLYLVYTDEIPDESNDTDIFLRFSDDNGVTWSASKRINNDPLGNGKAQFLPAVALDQSTGNLAITWLDCRNSPGNNSTQVWGTVSTNGGVTFEPNIQISKGTSNTTAAGFNFGDYDKMDFVAGKFYRSWADNSNSTGDNPAGTGGATDVYTAAVIVTSGGGGGSGPFLLSPNPVFEGQSTTLSGSFVDTISAIRGHNVSVDWGDGTTTSLNLIASANHFSISHKYLDDQQNSAIPVKVAVTSAFGFESKSTTQVLVYNEDPTARIGGAPTAAVAAGKKISLFPIVTDPGIRDTFSYSWSVKKNNASFDSGSAGAFSFTPDTAGVYTVNLTVTDNSGGVGVADPVTIVVTAGPPSARGLINDGPKPRNTDVTIAFDTPAGTGPLTYDIDLNGNGAYGPGETGLTTPSVTEQFAAEGVYHIKGRIHDGAGLVSADYFTDVLISDPINTGNGGLVSTRLIAAGSDASVAGFIVSPSVVRVYDTGGALKYTLQPLGPGYTGGYRVATGDVNGDGVTDVVIASGVGGDGTVHVISGADGTTELFTLTPYGAGFSSGLQVAAADFNRDGFADVVVAPDRGTARPVLAFSGQTQAQMFSVSPFGTAYTAGISVAAADVNGDMFPDLVVGQATTGSKVNVYTFNKTTQTLNATPYRSFTAMSTVGYTGGVFVSAGDMDGDGRAEIIVGSNSSVGVDARVRVFNGATNVLMRDFVAFPGYRGGVRVAAVDLDGDGKADLVLAPGKTSAALGSTRVLGLRGTNLTSKFILTYNDPLNDGAFQGGVFVG